MCVGQVSRKCYWCKTAMLWSSYVRIGLLLITSSSLLLEESINILMKLLVLNIKRFHQTFKHNPPFLFIFTFRHCTNFVKASNSSKLIPVNLEMWKNFLRYVKKKKIILKLLKHRCHKISSVGNFYVLAHWHHKQGLFLRWLNDGSLSHQKLFHFLMFIFYFWWFCLKKSLAHICCSCLSSWMYSHFSPVCWVD